MIKAGIVDHQRCVANEGKEFIRNFYETFVLLQKFSRKSVDCEGLGRHIAVGIEIDVKSRSGRDSIQQFDTTKFDDPMPLARIQTGSFDVQDDFAHSRPTRESLDPFRHCSNAGQNFTHLSTCSIKTL